MAYYNKTISIYGTELQFVQALIAAITEADSRITCTTTDIEAQYAAGSGTPSFTLSVDGDYTIVFTRPYSVNNSVAGFKISVPIFGNKYDKTIAYSSSTNGGLGKNQTGIRTVNLSIITNSEDVYFRIAPYNGNVVQNGLKLLSTKSGGNTIIGRGEDATNIMTTVFVTADSSNQAYTTVNRIPYTYAPTGSAGVEVLQNKVFLENTSSNRAFTLSKLWDVSTVAADSRVVIGSDTFYAVDSHTLMLIEQGVATN